jgi:hypothetical protein
VDNKNNHNNLAVKIMGNQKYIGFVSVCFFAMLVLTVFGLVLPQFSILFYWSGGVFALIGGSFCVYRVTVYLAKRKNK